MKKIATRAAHDRERHQPAGEELPGRQREQVERERPAEDRDRAAAVARRRVPVEREASSTRAIMPAPVTAAMTQRQSERDEIEHRFDRQLERLAVDDDAAELAEARRLEREERAVEHREGDDGEAQKTTACTLSVVQNTARVAERVEPERLDVVGERRAGAEDSGGEQRRAGTGGRAGAVAAVAAASRRPRRDERADVRSFMRCSQ